MDGTTNAHLDDFMNEQWLSSEGQLGVDVIEREQEIIVRSAIAGVSANDLDITLTEDTLTIRGERAHEHEETHQEQLHVQECYWGAFSRSIILPSHVDPDSVDATLKRGILTVVMKKVEMDKKIHVNELT